MTKKRFTLKRLLIFVIAACVSALVIYIAYSLSLACQDVYESKYSFEPTDDSLLSDTIKASVFGKSFKITEDQINTYLYNKLCIKQSSEQSSEGELQSSVSENPDADGSGVEKIRLYLYDDDNIEIYARVRFLGFRFGVFSRASVGLDQNILRLRLYDAKVGKLDIPEGMLELGMRHILSGDGRFMLSGTTVSVIPSKTYSLDKLDLTVTLEKLDVHKGYIRCRTNSMSIEVISSIAKYLSSKEGQKLLRSVLNMDMDELKETVLSYLKDKLKSISKQDLSELKNIKDILSMLTG